MKDNKEKIIEILKEYYKLMIALHFEDIASEIEALYSDYFERQFVEWIGKNARINIIKMGIGLHSGDRFSHKKLTTDELYEYWKTEIKDKQ